MPSAPIKKIAPWFLIGLVSVSLVAGCRREAKPTVADATSTDTGVKRIILLTNGDDPFWDAMRNGMDKAAEDLDLKGANLAAFLDKGDFGEEAQINKLTQYASQSDIGAVAISSVDAKNRGIADAMMALRAKGVHVITIDSDMDNKETRFAYLGTNNVIGGEELGKAAKGIRPGGGKYATFVGLKTVANAIERIGGFGVGAGSGFESRDSLADNGDEDLAQENVKAALNKHADLDTLVGIWAYNAHAIARVVAERNIRDKTTIVVFDAAPAALDDMANGMIDAMVVQNPYQMGYLGTQLMKALIEDDHEAIQKMFPKYDAVTKKFASAGEDIYTTELRVVVPDKDSPLKAEMFNPETKFFKYSEFRDWMRERNLTGS